MLLSVKIAIGSPIEFKIKSYCDAWSLKLPDYKKNCEERKFYEEKIEEVTEKQIEETVWTD